MNTVMYWSHIKGILLHIEKIKYLRINAELEQTCVTYGRQ